MRVQTIPKHAEAHQWTRHTESVFLWFIGKPDPSTLFIQLVDNKYLPHLKVSDDLTITIGDWAYKMDDELHFMKNEEFIQIFEPSN